MSTVSFTCGVGCYKACTAGDLPRHGPPSQPLLALPASLLREHHCSVSRFLPPPECRRFLPIPFIILRPKPLPSRLRLPSLLTQVADAVFHPLGRSSAQLTVHAETGRPAAGESFVDYHFTRSPFFSPINAGNPADSGRRQLSGTVCSGPSGNAG